MLRHILVAAILIGGGAACKSTPGLPSKPLSVSAFRIVHHEGGTHYRTLVYNGAWLQTFNHQLLILSNENSEPIRSVALGKLGETGPAVDMIVHSTSTGERLFIVIEDDELLEMSLESPSSEILRRISAAQLGIRPRRLSAVDGEVYISGRGGVVRLSDLQKIHAGEEDVSRVAKSEFGLIACSGRRAFRIEDGRYVGSASDVQMFPPSFSRENPEARNESSGNAPRTSDLIIFSRQGEQNVLVGLMTSDVRELDAARATVSVPGQARSVRILGDRLWIVTDEAVHGYLIGQQELTEPIYVNSLGAFDVGQIDELHMAIAGTFGRAQYGLGATPDSAAPAFERVHREPGHLPHALTDGRHILAGGREGLWMYLINSRVELTARQFDSLPPPAPISAIVSAAAATISDDRRSVTITPVGAEPASAVGAFTYSDPNGALLRTVVAVDGDFWIGHDRGITVIRPGLASIPKSSKSGGQPAANQVAGEVRFAGPVLYIYPLLVGGGASFVSEYGGFGVAKFVDESLATPN